MTISIQNIINGALAIAVTLLIYQNNQLKDNIETLKGYAQLDTDKAWDRMDKMEDKININYENFEKMDLYTSGLAKGINNNIENISILFGNFDISTSNYEVTDSKIENNRLKIKYIEDYLVESFGEE